MAAKARIKKNCRDVSREIYIRCRLFGSCVMWFWLARIIRGRSQQDKIRKGVERESVARYGVRKVHPVSDEVLSQSRLVSAIRRLCRSVVGHSHLCGVSQVVGMSIMVGMRIFSIVGGLSFGGGRSRVFEQLRL